MEISLHELRTLLNSDVSARDAKPMGQNIVVLDRGFVYVGDCTLRDDILEIAGAKNIRYWGTKEGLGQLRNGPLPETKLDDTGTVLAPWRAVIAIIACKGF